MTKEQKKQLYGFGLPIILGTILLLGASYAWLQLTLNGTKDNVLKVGTLSLELDDIDSVAINGDGVVPVLDEVGLTQKPYTFTLRNNGKVDSKYTIYLEDVELSEGESPLPDTVIKYNLTKDDSELATELLSTTIVEGKRVLDTGVISAESEYIYNLKLWVDQTATREQAAGKVFKGIIKVEAQQVIEQPPTPEECFTFEQETGTITNYLCGSVIIDMSSYTTKPNTQSPAGRIIADVVIPKTIGGTVVKKIGEYVFGAGWGEGTGITSVVLPEGLTEIGIYAFYYNKLTNVTIPSTVIEIGTYAFGHNQLTNVTLSEGVEEIADYAFSENPLTTVIIPASVTKLHRNLFYMGSLTKVIMKGKRDVSDFVIYGSRGNEASDSFIGSPFHYNDNYSPTSGWLEGSICKTYATEHFSDPDFGDNTNPCIDWELKD